MRIGILTFHRAYNCGAVLQAWALKTVLERMGHKVEFPICNHVGETKRWLWGWVNHDYRGIQKIRSFVGRLLLNGLSIPNEDILRMRYRKFRESNLPERVCTPNLLDRYYDVVIVGSDQVWCAKLTGLDAPIFFAENLPERVRKIAYAASYGDKPLEEGAIKRIVSSISKFSNVSVREPLAKEQLSKLTVKKIDLTLDPTLLLCEDDYCAIETKSGLPSQPYLLMYSLSTAPFFINTAKALANRLGVRCVIAPCYQYSRLGAPKGLTYGTSPDRLVGLARGAKYIVAGSFHGTVMGVVFNKPFLSLRANVDMYESRPAALLNMMGCGNRLVNPATPLEDMEGLLKTNVAPDAYEKLEVKRRASLYWLKEAIG